MKKLISLFVISAFLFTLVPALPASANGDLPPNYGFIPNSGEASVSKVDLVSGNAVARYWTAPRLGQEVDAFGVPTPGTGFPIAPFDWRAGRIGLDPQGNAWAINTGADGYTASGKKYADDLQGTVARIQLDTSLLTTTNNDHSAPLAFGADEAVQIFAVGAPGDIPRTINWVSEDTAWIGFHMAWKKNGYYAQFEYDDSGVTPTFEPTGKKVESTSEWDLAPYNATIDKNGRLWFVSYGSGHLRRNPGNTYGATNGVYSFDTKAEIPQGTLVKYSGITSGYGILVDNTPDNVIVYVTILETNNTLFVLNTAGGNTNFTSVPVPNMGGPRGMAFDNDGVIWIAASSGNSVCSYNPIGGATASYTGFGIRPVGVGKDAQGKMWVVIRNDGQATGMIRGFDPPNPAITNDIGLGNRPYAYADFVIPPQNEELTVSKTAVTSYDREHFWSIDKSVETEKGHTVDEDTPKIWLYADGSGDEIATWKVDVTYEGYKDSDHSVSGEITIENTGDVDAVITSIADVLAGTAITVACGVEPLPYTLPVGETLTCTYDEDVDACSSEYVLNITSINNNTGFTHIFTINYDPITGDINGTGYSSHAGTQTLSEFDYTITDGVISYIKFRSDYDVNDYFWFPAFSLNGDGSLGFVNIGGDNVWNAEGTWTKTGCMNEVTVTTERDEYFADAVIVWGEPDEDINESVEITDTNEGFADEYGEVTLNAYDYEAGQVESYEYSEDFAYEDYDECGSYPYDNTAEVIGDDETVLDSAEAMLKVNVQCHYYETAFAKDDDAICFIPTFKNWGWTNPITPGTYEMDLWAAAGQCDTGKGTLVGSVTVAYGADNNVTVTYNLSPGYIKKETHVYAGKDMFPKDRRGRSTVAPGLYTNKSPFDGSQVYVIAHAVVGIPDPNFGPQE